MTTNDEKYSGIVRRVMQITRDTTMFELIENKGQTYRTREFPMQLDPSVITGEKIKVEIIKKLDGVSDTLYSLKVLSGKYEGLEYEYKLR